MTCKWSQVRVLYLPPSGPVVQLVRTPACHAGGRGFESLPDRHLGEVADATASQFLCFLTKALCCAQWRNLGFGKWKVERKSVEAFVQPTPLEVFRFLILNLILLSAFSFQLSADVVDIHNRADDAASIKTC